MKIILCSKYQCYKKALDVFDLETLDARKEYLSLQLANNGASNEKTKHIFPVNSKLHNMETRKAEKFKVPKANSDKLKKVEKFPCFLFTFLDRL